MLKCSNRTLTTLQVYKFVKAALTMSTHHSSPHQVHTFLGYSCEITHRSGSKAQHTGQPYQDTRLIIHYIVNYRRIN